MTSFPSIPVLLRHSGTLACVKLEASEIGVPVSEDEQRALLTRLYGSAIHAPPSAMVVESTAMLALERQRAAAAAAAAAANPAASSARPRSGGMAGAAAGDVAEVTTRQVLALQKEVRTANGKRRIMPVSIDAPASTSGTGGGGTCTCICTSTSSTAAPPSSSSSSSSSATAAAASALAPPRCNPTVTSLTSQPSRTTVSFVPAGSAPPPGPSVTFTPGVVGAPPFGGVEGGPSPRPNGAISAHEGSSQPPAAPLPPTGAQTQTQQPAAKRPPATGQQQQAGATGAAPKRARLVVNGGGGRAGGGGHARFGGTAADEGGGNGSVGGDGGGNAGAAFAGSAVVAAAAAAGVLAVLPAAPVPSGALALDLPAARPADGDHGLGGGGMAASGFAPSAFASAPPRTLEAMPAVRGSSSLGGANPRMGEAASALSNGTLGAEWLLSCSWQGEVLWTAALPSPVTLLAGNSSFAACACADGRVYVFTAAGRRAVPPLLPCGGGIAALAADLNHTLMVVGCRGEVVTYSDLPQQPRCSLRCSASPLMHDPAVGAGAAPAGGPGGHVVEGSNGASSAVGGGNDAASASPPRLLDASLLPDGKPLLLMTHGAFTYADGLQSWLSMGDEAFGLSEHRSSLPPTMPDGLGGGGALSLPPSLPLTSTRRLQPSRGPPSLAALQGEHALASGRYEKSAAGLAQALAAAPSEHQRLVSTAHLEHQMAAAIALGNGAEYREWLRAYAHALGQQYAVRQVREICDELLGPMTALDELPPAPSPAAPAAADMAKAAGPATPLRWAPTVAGLCKRTLLREVVLPALATNRSLQRILSEYVECLGAL